MRIGEIRRMIREALAGIHPQQVRPYTEEPRDDYGDFTGNLGHQKKMSRLFDAPNFRKQAERLYGNLSVPIHILPVYSISARWLAGYSGGRRGSRLNPAEASEFLTSLGMPEDVVTKLTDDLSSGHSIFAIHNTRMMKGFLPTPWMAVHAMFDNNHKILPYPTGFKETLDEYAQAYNDHFDDSYNDSGVHIMMPFTMKSARDSEIPVGRYGDLTEDAFAEIMTQAILDRRGFHFNPTGVAHIDAILQRLKELLSNVRAEFEKVIAGKLIIVDNN